MGGPTPSRKLSGVQNTKLNRKAHMFLCDEGVEPAAKASKACSYWKPVCGMDVVFKIVFSCGGFKEKTGMEVWQNTRSLFPFFAKCNKFTLRSVLNELKSSADFAARVTQNSRGSGRPKVRFFLKDDVFFSYKASEIIGKGASLSRFTNALPDKFRGYLTRKPSQEDSPFPSSVASSSEISIGQTGESTSELTTDPSSDNFGNKMTEIFRPEKSLQRRSHGKFSSLLAKTKFSSVGNKEKPRDENLLNTNFLKPNVSMGYLVCSSENDECRGMDRTFPQKDQRIDSSGLNASTRTACRVIVFNNNNIISNDKLGDSEHISSNSCEILRTPSLPEVVEQSHTALTTSSKVEPRKIPTGLEEVTHPPVSSLSAKYKANSLEFNFNPVEDQHLNLASSLNKIKDYYHHSKVNYEEKALKSPSSKEIVINVNESTPKSYPSKNEISSFQNKLDWDYRNRSCTVTPLVLEEKKGNNGDEVSPLKDKPSSGEENESSLELEVLYTNLKREEPDSTNSPLNSQATRIHNKGERSLEPLFPPWCGDKVLEIEKEVIEEQVSSSTSLVSEAEDFSLPLVKCVRKDDLVNNCIVDKFSNYSSQYEWFAYDERKSIICCSFCNNQELCPVSENDISLILALHRVSKMHLLYAFIEEPKPLEFVYYLIKNSLNESSVDSFKEEFFGILGKYDTPNTTEETLTSVIELLSECSQEVFLQHIRKKKLPFSIKLNFCQEFAVVRTLDEKNMATEAVVIVKHTQDRSVVGFLNSVSLGVNGLIAFEKCPPCGDCKHCLGKSCVLTENSSFLLPPRCPTLNELTSVISNDVFVLKYFNFVREISRLYLEFPLMFISLNQAWRLRDEIPWTLVDFVKEHFSELIQISKEIYLQKRDASALGLIIYNLDLNEEVLATLEVIKSVYNKLNKFYKCENLSCGYVDKTKGIDSTLETLTREIKTAKINFRIRIILISFLTELKHNLSVSNETNGKNLIHFFDLKLLCNLENFYDVKVCLLKVISYFEKFTNCTNESVMVDLSAFAQSLLQLQTIQGEVTEVNYLLNIFERNFYLKRNFPIAYKFYSLLKLLPVFPLYNCHGSWFKVNIVSKLLAVKFGKEMGPFMLSVLCNGSNFKIKSIAEYVKNAVPKKPR